MKLHILTPVVLCTLLAACGDSSTNTPSDSSSSDSQNSSEGALSSGISGEGSSGEESSGSRTSQPGLSSSSSYDPDAGISSATEMLTTTFDWQACVKSGKCGTITDARDNRSYKWITIGDYQWFGENLKYSKNESLGHCSFTDPRVKTENQNCQNIGRMYTWSEAMNYPEGCNRSICQGATKIQHQGICPSGWHISSQGDWDALYQVLTNGTDAFQAQLKSTGWDHGTDVYGFSAVPTDGDSAFYWRLHENETRQASGMTLKLGFDSFSGATTYKESSHAVRCVKDYPVSSSSSPSSSSASVPCASLPTGSFCDNRDGKAYTYRRYGVQYWMTQNLNWEGAGKCHYSSPGECQKRGRLYSPYESQIDGNTNIKIQQGACPYGWRTPSYEEWQELAYLVVGVQNLKGVDDATNTQWNQSFNNQDSAGFHLYPSGYQNHLTSNLPLKDSLTSAHLMTITEHSSQSFSVFLIDTQAGNPGTSTWFGMESSIWERDGVSVRCLKTDWSVAP